MVELTTKIESETPNIIFVCTQESRSGDANHFQHVFGEKLKENYTRLLKVDGSKYTGTALSLFSKNRNCRTRIYYLKNKVINRSTNSKNSTNSTKIIITHKEEQLTVNSSLGSFSFKGIYKNAILTKVTLYSKNIDYKFAVVNTHLFFTDKSNTYLSKRTEQFFNLVREFNLTDLYEKDNYNIFFCGVFNS